MTAAIKPYETQFWALMKEVGIDPTLGSTRQIESNVQTLKNFGEWPVEWYPALKEFITDPEHEVLNIATVLKGMTAWIARGGPPGVRTATADAEDADISDEFIIRHTRDILERVSHDYGDGECFGPEDGSKCSRNHRTDLKRVVDGVQGQGG